jgi:hypothetical protein
MGRWGLRDPGGFDELNNSHNTTDTLLHGYLLLYPSAQTEGVLLFGLRAEPSISPQLSSERVVVQNSYKKGA